MQHLGQPIDRALLVGSGRALDEGADRVVMRIAHPIVNDRLGLDALFRDDEGEMNYASLVRRSRAPATLKGVQTFACVAIAQFGEVAFGGSVHLDPIISQPAFAVRERALD